MLRHRGLTLVMSNVILDYLARTTGKFEAATEQDRWHAREWLSWENDAITNVARVRHFARFRKVDPMIVDFFRPGAEAALDFVDKSLEGRQWLVGEQLHHRRHRLLRAAWCSWPRAACRSTTRPNARAWCDRLMAMPGFALPYDLIPKKDAELPLPA